MTVLICLCRPRDAFLVPVINCLTSFFAGFVVFSTLGHMAHLKNTSVDNVTAQGQCRGFCQLKT